MIFSVYLGNRQGMLNWQQMLARHATWLGLNPQVQSYCLADGRDFSVCWLKPDNTKFSIAPVEIKNFLLVEASTVKIYQQDQEITTAFWRRWLDEINSNSIQLAVSLKSGDLSVAVPPTTPEQCYYTQDHRGTVFGNDMRLLMRWVETHLDERAIYALFRYRAIPAPLTMVKHIKRVPNGHIFNLASDSGKIALEPFYQPASLCQEEDPTLDPVTRIQETLDDMLVNVPQSTAVFFSGGVDSGLLAARLAEMGRKDIKLINYVFQAQDQEANLAASMAANLGLTCEHVLFDSKNIPSMLDRIGQDYRFPFGDLSVIPTNLMLHASLPTLSEPLTVIEGTGADGAFGMAGKYEKWQYIYGKPRPIRWAVAKGYEWFNLWEQDSTLEGRARRIRRSTQLPFQQAAAMSSNPFDGIAYKIPDDIRVYLEGLVSDHIEILGTGLDIRSQISLLDLVHVCAGRYAAKSAGPLQTRGIKPIYPFLQMSMLGLSNAISWDQKFIDGQPKALLKSLLAQSVPYDMVYRPKKSFSPPTSQIFAHTAIQTYLSDIVLSSSNPLLNFIRPNVIRRMVNQSQGKRPLSNTTYNFLWVLLFTSAWLQQIDLSK